MARDETLTLAFGPSLRRSLQRTLAAGMRRRYPARNLRLVELPRPVRSALGGPVLAFLGASDALPAADPVSLGWIVCPRSCDAGGQDLWQDVSIQLARLDAPTAGEGPVRRCLTLLDAPTRGELLRLPLPRPQPLSRVPRLEHGLCRGPAGCRLCANACPAGGITIDQGRVLIDEDACRQCGLCVAACPSGALESAATCDAQWLAALAAARRQGGGSAGLRLACRPLPPGGGPQIPIACVAEVSAGRAVEAELAGVPLSVACPDPDCPLHEFAAAAPGTAMPEAVRAADFAGLAALDRPRRLAMLWGRSLSLEAAADCTLCGICTQVCVAGALRLERLEAQERLVFDPSACAACAACLPACPADALARADPNTPQVGLAVLRESGVRRCASCGAPLGAEALWQGAREAIGASGQTQLMQELDLCPTCRTRALWQRAGKVAAPRSEMYPKGT